MIQTTQERTVPTSLEVTENSDRTAWNEYVARRDGGGLFYLAEWAKAFAVYRLPVLRLAAVRGGRIVGALPLVWQRSLLFGNHFVGLPWFDAAGVLADDDQVREALVQRAVETAAGARAGSVQLRHVEPLDLSRHVRTDKVLMRLALEQDPEQLWKRFKPTVRNQVRKAGKCGLVAERGGAELLGAFFRVYSENMRDLGSPSHSLRFFEAVLEAFAQQTTIYAVRLEGEVIGAGLTMANGNRLEIPWASSLRRYNGLCVNHLMYWEILQDACRDGFEWFHFGRSSKDSGPYRFKRQWGAEPVQLHWYFLATNGRIANPDSSPQKSYDWGSRLWRRLPLRLSQSLGPRIIAKLP
jgi:FemAB-related protein (PEP-CTERM system-associated)